MSIEMWISHLDGWLAPRPPPPLHLLSFFETPAVTLQGGAKRKSGEARRIPCFCVLCVRTDKSIRSDRHDSPPKGSAQKQQTHLNHVVLILREIAPPSCAAGDTNLRRGGNRVWLHARRQINIPPSLEAAATTHRCGPRLRADARLGKLPLTIHHPCVHSRRHEPTRAPAPETLHRRRPPPTPLLCSSLLLSSPFSNLRPIMHACRYASQTTDSRAPTE
jgi:hypothetical protein